MTEFTLKQQKANRKLWVEALRSGKYKRTTQKLRSLNDGFCCLGVLADLAGCEWKKEEDFYSADGAFGSAPAKAREFVGLTAYLGCYTYGDLSDLNDSGKTFAEIADIIESEPFGLFVESIQP